MATLTELQRLILQLERELVAQAHLRSLVIEADKTVATHRREVRVIKARIKRTRLGHAIRAQH